MKFLAIYALIGLLYGILVTIFNAKILFGALITAIRIELYDGVRIHGDKRVKFVFAIFVEIFTVALMLLAATVIWPYYLMNSIKCNFFTEHEEDEP